MILNRFCKQNTYLGSAFTFSAANKSTISTKAVQNSCHWIEMLQILLKRNNSYSNIGKAVGELSVQCLCLALFKVCSGMTCLRLYIAYISWYKVMTGLCRDWKLELISSQSTIFETRSLCSFFLADYNRISLLRDTFCERESVGLPNNVCELYESKREE